MYLWNILYFFVSGLAFFGMAWIWQDAKLGQSVEDTLNFVVKYFLICLFIWGMALGVLGAHWIAPTIGLCK